ncbi:unnamed protein product [Acanthosepion pharaonis]|uniref:Uncharacterized protein n=1 Tax=Acanthosepion pharaonis TaxID=158019 RepID=A0A812CVZ6_ACAPH|nr:unnamed protein product [Sepia pharaonis]
MPTFKVQGQVYHRIGSLLPEETSTPKFLQLYFIADYNLQAETRIGILPPSGRVPRRDVILLLQAMLHEVNSYIRSFKYALENAPFPSFSIVIDADKRPHDEHERRYNAPACNEVAAIIIHGEQDRTAILSSNQEAALFAGFQRPIDHMTHCSTLYFSLMVTMATTSAFPFILRVANLQRLPKPYRARPSTHTGSWLGMETSTCFIDAGSFSTSLRLTWPLRWNRRGFVLYGIIRNSCAQTPTYTYVTAFEMKSIPAT